MFRIEGTNENREACVDRFVTVSGVLRTDGASSLKVGLEETPTTEEMIDTVLEAWSWFSFEVEESPLGGLVMEAADVISRLGSEAEDNATSSALAEGKEVSGYTVWLEAEDEEVHMLPPSRMVSGLLEAVGKLDSISAKDER